MTTLTLPQIDGHDLLTHSRLTCKKTCGKKHHLRYILGIRKDYSAAPLRIGSNVHNGLDARKKGKSEQDAIAIACQGYPDAIDATQNPEYALDLTIEQEVVARLLAGYFWRWAGDTTIKSILASEQSFELPIINPETGKQTPTFRFAGKIDGIIELADERVAVLEHKTTGDSIAPESDYWAQLAIDQQISGYVIAGQSIGHPVETVLYDVIKKPDIAPRQIPLLDDRGFKIVLDAEGNRVLKVNIKKNGEPGAGHGEPRQSGDAEKGWVLQTRTETPEEFGDRLTDDIVERPDHYFARREIPRLTSDLDEFRQELWDMQRDMAEAIKHNRHFRNTAACVGFGTCEYLSICANGIDPANPPSGFVRVPHLHPELQGEVE